MNEKLDTHFYNFLAEGNIICELKADTREEAVRELVRLLVRNNAGLDADAITASVLEREKVVPTVIAPGMAVPHARLDDLPNMLIALGTTTAGIDFNCPGMPPVNVIILMLTPRDDPGLHLQVLAGLAKDFARSETIRMVAAMESPGSSTQPGSAEYEAITATPRASFW
ncbi:MAG: PTS sugar transporter subunit IIA [Victivallales bacterium]|nr:PTS sugar transporter subunit IIA [Victivallales bacterium]